MRSPLATYRIQFNRDFRFEDARGLVAHLHSLGISDLYASPLLQARSGSLHGYDVTDPSGLNPELGGDEEFKAMARDLKARGMGLLVDIVPNHMAAHPENPWWRDVLENGPDSPYASYFDIDWHPATSGLENRILLPVLGDSYDRVLENQEFTLVLDEGGFSIRYYELKLPVNFSSHKDILTYGLERFKHVLGPGDPGPQALEDLTGALDALPSPALGDAETTAERRRAKDAVKSRLWRLYSTDTAVKGFLDETMRAFNGEKGDQKSFALMDRVLDDQFYRLAYWRRAADAINYRRFFNISDLACLRIEDPEVFEATHALVGRLVREGSVSGLRIDHIDGLSDPLEYLRRLQRAVAPAAGEPGGPPGLYVVVEKILLGDEELPEEWPVCGTTGYEFIHDMNGVFIDPDGLDALASIYAKFTGLDKSFAEVCYARKHQVMEELFPAEVRSLGNHLSRLAAEDRRARDLPSGELVRALVEVTACLPIYRTYIRSLDVRKRDRLYIERAFEAARRRAPEGRESQAAFDFVEQVLSVEPPGDGEGQRQAWLDFVMRWQQFTGPVMAKGLEDTALYLYNRLVSLKEVGTDPSRAETPVDLETFHVRNQETLERWPYTLNATSTHDTKRSEDVRARINVLSEIPGAWSRRLARWSRWSRPRRREVNGHPVPDPDMEVLIYQTLIGAWPLQAEEVPDFRERLNEYFIKAAREAKVHTSWIRPNDAYESALLSFVDGLLEPLDDNEFLENFLRFQKRIAFFGALNALGQVLLKIASPGVPDFYQGSELWTFSLVDPDNRRPVDFPKRVKALEEIKRREAGGLIPLAQDLLTHWEDGRIKLYVTYKALAFRRSHRSLFLEGSYVPLNARGARKDHLCAFARRHGDGWALVCVPRWLTRLGSPGKPPVGRRVWEDTELRLPVGAPEAWRDVLTGESVTAHAGGAGEAVLPLHDIFSSLPVALLEGVPRGEDP